MDVDPEYQDDDFFTSRGGGIVSFIQGASGLEQDEYAPSFLFPSSLLLAPSPAPFPHSLIASSGLRARRCAAAR